MSRKINKSRLFRNVILLLLIVGSIGLYLSNRYVKTKGFDNLSDFVSTYNTNKKLANNASPTDMQLLLSDADYTFLKNKRQESLDRGVQVNKGDNYVNCKVVCNGDTIKGEIRLKGHMTDHLEGIKWSFRVKTKDEVMGMYRFSLQNPGTRNYAYEWVYHELLNNEDVIHLKYDFINLKLNDTDLGIYAIEEHFGQHVLRDNERPKGAILRWNPELYWNWRLDELKEVYLDEDYSSFSSSFVEPYDKGVVRKDSVLIETYQKGAALLEAFRRGDKPSSEVFDIQKMARFHAVIDLVGGYHSLDWSDVKFFYNSETGKVEPVGYESFSIRETIKIAGQRTPENYEMIGFNYHNLLFSDRVFFEAYIQNLERICSEEYFNSFTKKIQDELDQKRGVLAAEYAYIKFSFQPYFNNIELIQHNIQLPKAFHAFLDSKNDSIANISITPVSDYPIDIIALVVDGKNEYPILTEFTLPPKARNTYAHYFNIEFLHDSKKLKDLKIKAKIPGSSTIFEVAVSDLPSYRNANIFKIDSIAPVQQDSIIVWVNDSTAILKGETIEIASELTIPANKTLYINKGQKLHFINNGRLIVLGTVNLLGAENAEIQLSGEKSDKPRIIVQNGSVIAANCTFLDFESNCINGENASLYFQKCTMADLSADFIAAQKSTITFFDCASGKMNSLGNFDRCLVKIKSFTAKNGNVFIKANGSDIELHESHISGYEKLANLDFSSDFSTWSSYFKTIQLMANLNNNSTFKCYAGTIVNSELGFKIDAESIFNTESSYLLYKTTTGLKTVEERVKA